MPVPTRGVRFIEESKMQDNARSSFAGKLFRLLPRPTKECPRQIGYREITTYGELLYRSRLECGRPSPTWRQ